MSGDDVADMNFGDYHGTVIKGYVLHDKGDGSSGSVDANNAIYDTATEVGLQQVKVQACLDLACSSVVDSSNTDASGLYALYLHTGIVVDTTAIYVVKDDSDGYLSTGNSISGVAQNDASNTIAERNTLNYVMATGETKTDYDFG